MARRGSSPTRRTLVWLPTVAWAGVIYFLSDQPDTSFQEWGLRGELLSIAGHLLAYGVLMALLLWSLRRSSYLPASHVAIVALALLAVYAVTDEFHQSFVPGRTATIFDWFTDMAGALLAWKAPDSIRRYGRGATEKLEM